MRREDPILNGDQAHERSLDRAGPDRVFPAGRELLEEHVVCQGLNAELPGLPTQDCAGPDVALRRATTVTKSVSRWSPLDSTPVDSSRLGI